MKQSGFLTTSVKTLSSESELPSSASPGDICIAPTGSYVYYGDEWLFIVSSPQGADDSVQALIDYTPIPSLLRYCPALEELVKFPAGTGKQVMSLESAIMRLNDIEEWTREEIADWLESLDLDITVNIEDVP